MPRSASARRGAWRPAPSTQAQLDIQIIGRRFESELRLYHRRLTLTGCAGCSRCFMPAVHKGDARPLLSINVKRERGRIAWLAMIGRLVTVSATFIHCV